MPGAVAHGGWQRSAKLRGTIAAALVAHVHVARADVERVEAGTAVVVAAGPTCAPDCKERALSTVVWRQTEPARHRDRTASRDLRRAHNAVGQARAVREAERAARDAEAVRHEGLAQGVDRLDERGRPHVA